MQMGLLLDYMQMFTNEAKKVNGNVSRKTISEWFGNKQAVQRNGYKDVLSFDSKSAVVVVGVSGIGKTGYVERFIELFPHVKLVSYDEANYKKEDEKERGKKVYDGRALEIVEEEILKYKDESIIVDSVCIQPYARAALFRFLADLGYEIHMVYFSKEYTEANIVACLRNRAIELVLFEEYKERNKNVKMSMIEKIQVRKDIVSVVAKERGMTKEMLIAETANNMAVFFKIAFLANAYKAEVEENRVWWQEKRGLFYLGADYCYVL